MLFGLEEQTREAGLLCVGEVAFAMGISFTLLSSLQLHVGYFIVAKMAAGQLLHWRQSMSDGWRRWLGAGQVQRAVAVIRAVVAIHGHVAFGVAGQRRAGAVATRLLRRQLLVGKAAVATDHGGIVVGRKLEVCWF